MTLVAAALRNVDDAGLLHRLAHDLDVRGPCANHRSESFSSGLT